jgi:peptidoglycan/LPS O-acetylase OafA/YrhL
VTEETEEQSRGVSRVNTRAAAWLAWVLRALCVAFAVLAVLLAPYTPPFPEGAQAWGVALVAVLLPSALGRCEQH